jgi:hypothetical protein
MRICPNEIRFLIARLARFGGSRYCFLIVVVWKILRLPHPQVVIVVVWKILSAQIVKDDKLSAKERENTIFLFGDYHAALLARPTLQIAPKVALLQRQPAKSHLAQTSPSSGMQHLATSRKHRLH